ncbi:Myosin-15 [Hordeum vulgare]|nr:Myosin-15 [Hordeum vulgare]
MDMGYSETEDEGRPEVHYNKDDPSLAEGTIFSDVLDCRNALATFAIKTKSEFVIDKSEPGRLTVHCAYKRCQTEQDKSHLPKCYQEAKAQKKYGVQLPYMRAFYGKQMALDNIYGKWSDSFQLLYTFKAEVEKASPRSVVNIDRHTVEFKLNGQKRCGILGHHGTHCKESIDPTFGEEDEHCGADNAPEEPETNELTEPETIEPTKTKTEEPTAAETDTPTTAETQATSVDLAPQTDDIAHVSDAPTIASVATSVVSPRKNYKRQAERGYNPLSPNKMAKGDTLSTAGGSVTGSNQLRRGDTAQVDARYPAILFKQQLTACVKKIFGQLRDNLKREYHLFSVFAFRLQNQQGLEKLPKHQGLVLNNHRTPIGTTLCHRSLYVS